MKQLWNSSNMQKSIIGYNGHPCAYHWLSSFVSLNLHHLERKKGKLRAFYVSYLSCITFSLSWRSQDAKVTPFLQMKSLRFKRLGNFLKCGKLIAGRVKNFHPGLLNPLIFLVGCTIKDKRQRKDWDFSTLWHLEIGHQNTLLSLLSPPLLLLFIG